MLGLGLIVKWHGGLCVGCLVVGLSVVCGDGGFGGLVVWQHGQSGVGWVGLRVDDGIGLGVGRGVGLAIGLKVGLVEGN